MNQPTSPPDTSPRELLSHKLKANGFRLTPQREKILDVFFNLPEGKHLSAEELQRILNEDDQSDISLATSYRTLHLLHSLGVLRELDFAEDHKHYELVREDESPHHHIVCVRCGKTDEFESPGVTSLAEEIAEAHKIQLMDIQLHLYGICQSCQSG
jgi:Fur family ferric uptake transcriptional regulator